MTAQKTIWSNIIWNKDCCGYLINWSIRARICISLKMKAKNLMINYIMATLNRLNLSAKINQIWARTKRKSLRNNYKRREKKRLMRSKSKKKILELLIAMMHKWRVKMEHQKRLSLKIIKKKTKLEMKKILKMNLTKTIVMKRSILEIWKRKSLVMESAVFALMMIDTCLMFWFHVVTTVSAKSVPVKILERIALFVDIR